MALTSHDGSGVRDRMMLKMSERHSGDWNFSVALAGNAEAVENGARGVGAVEG